MPPLASPTPPLTSSRHTLPASAPPQPLDRALRALLPGQSWSKLRQLIETGKLSLDGRVVTDCRHPVTGGSTLELRLSAPRPSTPGGARAPLPRDALVYLDAQLLVVHKPSGLSSVPFDDHERGALSQLLPALLRRRGATGRSVDVGVVHRLDKETSGLLVFTRTALAKRALEQQFRLHSVHRRYLALVEGVARDATYRSRLVRDRGDGRRGSTAAPHLGQEAVTHVRLREPLGEVSLVECRLETGRTHQIRIHLSEAGHPLLGERVYRPATAPPRSAPRLLLHAAELGFEHPVTGEQLRFEAPPPLDFAAELERYRALAARPPR